MPGSSSCCASPGKAPDAVTERLRERGIFLGQPVHLALHCRTLLLRGTAPPAREGRVGDVVRGEDGGGQVTPGDLVLALRARLDPRQAAADRQLDRLIVAELEVQEGNILQATPVAAVEAIVADQVERAGDPAAAATGHDQQHPVGHPLAEQRKERRLR